MKVIEILYPEFSNIYADLYNILYLSKCNSDIKVIKTSYNDEPYFVNNKVDMVYMGSMPDSKLESAVIGLKSYKNKIKELIDAGTIFLVTGNALEIFGSYIENGFKKFNALSIFDYYVVKDMNNKHASWFLGKYENNFVVGHRNQFSKCFNIRDSFIDIVGGFGSDLENSNEGIKYNNFYATYLLGPFLILNPYMTKYFLKLLGLRDKLLYEEEIIKAYNLRVSHFNKDNARFIMKDHG